VAVTDSLVELADAFVTKLEADKDTLGLEGVLYGDDGTLFPRTPWVCVTPTDKTRELDGAAGPSGQTLNTLAIIFMIYHSRIQSTEKNRRECDMFAESIETFLHKDVRVGGIVIHGYVVQMESGQAAVGSALFQATRLTWQGITKTLL
jgi:hypothetical protein